MPFILLLVSRLFETLLILKPMGYLELVRCLRQNVSKTALGGGVFGTVEI